MDQPIIKTTNREMYASGTGNHALYMYYPFINLAIVVHSAQPARLQVDNTHAYILTECEGGNPVSAPGVGGS